MEVFQITLGMNFSWILVWFWRQVGTQNGAKIDIKGNCKNDEKVMMTRMAKKLDIGGYAFARHPCPEPRGGGRRRAKPLLHYSKKHWMKELGDGCWHARPKPPDAQRAGGILKISDDVLLILHTFLRIWRFPKVLTPFKKWKKSPLNRTAYFSNKRKLQEDAAPGQGSFLKKNTVF